MYVLCLLLFLSLSAVLLLLLFFISHFSRHFIYFAELDSLHGVVPALQYFICSIFWPVPVMRVR